ncbi:MAG: type I restriction endonuclease subunit R [Bacteroidetes bacterium]|jgi:type I restriction enzyme, R subunit|nr:type I restriction endonuclease subunit R [Bacteroidota bacterium]
MTHQPEQILEDNLIKQLSGLGYKIVSVNNEKDLLANLKSQLEKHNKTSFSDTEFKKILNHLSKGNVFEKAKLLRDKFRLSRDNGDSSYIEFIQQEQWCKNQFQVTHQVTMEGKYKNRYDVTILINGFPLVHIELKRRGIELKEAFNQINRYQRHTFGSSFGLFQYVQVFVISNGENTKYYANNRHQSFKQTFYWSDIENRIISQLESFAKEFLEPCHLSKMITKYVVLNETNKVLMVLRPYQYYATEAIIERVKNSHKNGYIWHTTGSGKTLTSFKASQVLIQLPKVHKVVFVVDRRDLDYQTIKEFNSFSKGSVDGTDNTRELVKQFTDTTKLIVTTLQKLNAAITKDRFLKRMEDLKDKRIVFIFDECHRSQFGDTHKRIKAFFQNNQMFGFTGTPIFDVNALSKDSIKHTTGELFVECLHKYVITDAIRDENVLKFSIEYIGRYKEKETSNTNLDIKVEDIDTKELFESPQRLEKITDYIIANHNRKTHNREFISLFCVNSIETLIKYYDLFKTKKAEGKHDLKIASIFSYTSNEEDNEADGMIYDDNSLSMAADPNVDYNTNTHSREKLDAIIEDYNQMYGTKFSTKDSDSFYNYFKDIAKRAKDYEKKHFDVNDRVDIILVVQMLLTGFDATKLNTLYADKNLKHHGLIQAFSRTNRILNEQKSQGNIVCFRNLKEATDDAITLFSNKNAKDIIILKPYEEYVQKFNIAFAELLKIAPTTNSVNDLPSEIEELEFIKAFRSLMRLKNVLSTFVDFDWEDLAMEEQKFENYKSKYLDLYDKVKSSHQKEKVSILDEVDFELELIHRDEINVAYILRLLSRLKKAKEAEREQHKKAIIDILSGEAKLRSKRELIEKFIEENLPHIKDLDDIPSEFESYWKDEQMKAFKTICKDERVEPEKLQIVISDYLFTERLPLRDDIAKALIHKPKLLERKTVTERVIHKIVSFVETFISGMAA